MQMLLFAFAIGHNFMTAVLRIRLRETPVLGGHWPILLKRCPPSSTQQHELLLQASILASQPVSKRRPEDSEN